MVGGEGRRKDYKILLSLGKRNANFHPWLNLIVMVELQTMARIAFCKFILYISLYKGMDEIKNSISKLKDTKSIGNDGLTSEFYPVF